LTPSFEGNPRTRHEILSRETKDLEAAHGVDFVILACTVFIQCQGVMDGQTDGQTDRRTDGRTPRRWLRCAKHSAIARISYGNSFRPFVCLFVSLSVRLSVTFRIPFQDQVR